MWALRLPTGIPAHTNVVDLYAISAARVKRPGSHVLVGLESAVSEIQVWRGIIGSAASVPSQVQLNRLTVQAAHGEVNHCAARQLRACFGGQAKEMDNTLWNTNSASCAVPVPCVAHSARWPAGVVAGLFTLSQHSQPGLSWRRGKRAWKSGRSVAKTHQINVWVYMTYRDLVTRTELLVADMHCMIQWHPPGRCQ